MDFMYYGDILIADLETGSTEMLDPEELDDLGQGVSAGLEFYERYRADEPLVIGSGLLTGTTAPASCLGFVLGESPVTGKPAVSPLHLFAGAEVKLSGFSLVVIKGNSEEPVYLWLHDGVADLIEARELAGKDTWETTDLIRREMGEQMIQVISTGPAGESASPLASFSINYWGSGDSVGLGAVMGEKKLKAVAVRGLGMIDADDPDAYYDGTREMLSGAHQWKGLRGVCEGTGAGDLDGWLKPLIHRHRSCFACPSACGTFVKYREDPGVMESSAVDEPGMLITDAGGPMWLMSGGWEPEPACRALEAMARRGVDLLRGSRELSAAPMSDPDRIDAAVVELGGTAQPGWPSGGEVPGGDLFGWWVPPLAGADEWLDANRIGFTLGICPIYLLLSGIDAQRIFDLCGPAAGVEIGSGDIEAMFG